MPQELVTTQTKFITILVGLKLKLFDCMFSLDSICSLWQPIHNCKTRELFIKFSTYSHTLWLIIPICYYIQCNELLICTFVTCQMGFQYKGNLSWCSEVEQYCQCGGGRNNSLFSELDWIVIFFVLAYDLVQYKGRGLG